MTLGSLFAGIGGFDLGFERGGFNVRWQVEQDGKAQSVLTRRFPAVRLYDDVRTVGAANLEPVDVICGGFPCQDVSVAGKREGLGGDRTGLFSEVVRIAREFVPLGLRWMVLENVPGLLSSHGGRDFHTVLSALADCGLRREYRILDSRYFGVAQRRRRVFIVLRARRLGDRAAQVLFEQSRGDRDSPAGDEARPDVAATLRGRSHGAGVNAPGRGGEDDQNLVTYALGSHSGTDGQASNSNHASGGPVGLGISREMSHSLRAGRVQTIALAGPLGGGNDGIGRRSEDDPSLVFGVHANQRGELRTSGLAGSLNGSRSGKQFEGVATALSASMGHHGHSSPRGDGSDNLIAGTLKATDGGMDVEQASAGHLTPQSMGVRRLTPLECERLQGFPDGWTCLCGAGHQGSIFCECADSPRYRQLGNAVTVPVAEWIARQILNAEGVER